MWVATPPACYRSLSGPSGPKCPGSVPRGVSGALRAPGSGVSKKCRRECPRSVKKVSGHSGDTLGTLWGHFLTLRRTNSTLRHSRDTSGPKGPRDSCSRPGGLQCVGACSFVVCSPLFFSLPRLRARPPSAGRTLGVPSAHSKQSKLLACFACSTSAGKFLMELLQMGWTVLSHVLSVFLRFLLLFVSLRFLSYFLVFPSLSPHKISAETAIY